MKTEQATASIKAKIKYMTPKGIHGLLPPYQAAIRMTAITAAHRAIDSDPRTARKQQRAFCGAIKRLVCILVRDLPEHEISFRFLDSSKCSASFRDDTFNQHQYALNLSIVRDGLIKYHATIAHQHDGVIRVYAEQYRDASIPMRPPAVVKSKASKVASVHSRMILATPFIAC